MLWVPSKAWLASLLAAGKLAENFLQRKLRNEGSTVLIHLTPVGAVSLRGLIVPLMSVSQSK